MTGADVSVILPVKGPGSYLPAALASVAEQTVSVAEILAIDDGMEPSAVAALANARDAGLPITVLEGPRTGPAAARNCGLDRAKGSLVAFIDDDDIWPADKLARQCRFLAENPDAWAVGGRIHWFRRWDATGRPLPESDDIRILHVNLGAYLVRRSLFAEIGRLDGTYLYSEDVDFLLRLVDSGRHFAILDDVMLHYRRHPNSMSASGSEREKIDFRRALFASLRRRRGLPADRPDRRLEKYLVSDRAGTR